VIAGGAPEHGWQPITIEEPRFAAVFDQTPPLVFAWHNDAIVLPPGARRLATGARCPVQGFSLCAPAPIVALQFHLEADAAKIALFRRAGKRDGDTAADEAAALAAQGRALEWLLHQLLAAH
jgi:GMP synthase-like glutamine amidotransferase